MNQYLWLSSAPPQLCKLPLKSFSQFLTGMAKEARTARTMNRILASSIYRQSEKIMQWSDPGCMQIGLRCAAHGIKHAKHLVYSSNEAIKSIRSPCLCLRGWLSRTLWCRGECLNLLICISTLFLNMIPWHLRHIDFGSSNVSCALSHCVCTNGVISRHNSETTRKLELCLCNEAHDESGEWHDCPWVPFSDALD